jgi:hypothetical protein
MTTANYVTEDYDDDRSIQIPRIDQNTFSQLYFKTVDNEEIYPKIYYKNMNKFYEYCILNENHERYYAKDRVGNEYYPKDHMGNRYVLQDRERNPKFINHLRTTFVHLNDVWSPFSESTNKKIQSLASTFNVYVVRPGYELGNLYLNIMTSKNEDKYLKWKKVGLNDERFQLDENDKFRNLDTYIEGPHRFIFISDERHYVDINRNVFKDRTFDLLYEIILNKKVYFIGHIYFVFDDKTERHNILSSDGKRLYAYKIGGYEMQIYMPFDLYKTPISTLTVDFDRTSFGQEFDGEKNLVSFYFDSDKNKIYLWYENDEVVLFEYDENKTKRRFFRDVSGNKQYFVFKIDKSTSTNRLVTKELIDNKVDDPDTDSDEEVIDPGNINIPVKQKENYSLLTWFYENLTIGFLAFIFICIMVIYAFANIGSSNASQHIPIELRHR